MWRKNKNKNKKLSGLTGNWTRDLLEMPLRTLTRNHTTRPSGRWKGFNNLSSYSTRTQYRKWKRVLQYYAFTSSFYLQHMDSQPSTSSGAMDQRRKDALKGYREVAYYTPFYLPLLMVGCTENAKSWSKQRKSEEPFVNHLSLLRRHIHSNYLHSQVLSEGSGKGICQDRRRYQGRTICWSNRRRGHEATGHRSL